MLPSELQPHLVRPGQLFSLIPIVYYPMMPYFKEPYTARVSGLILEALLCACFSPGESCFSDVDELVDELRLGKIFDLSSWVVEDVLDFVITDASSDRI